MCADVQHESSDESFRCWQVLFITMGTLLMFVTLLHIITLAVLFIATMEKVSMWNPLQQITFQNYLLIRYNSVHMSEFMNAYLIFCMIQSWWVWDGTEHSDLWYNCRLDNETEAWFCASSGETGKTIHLST